MSLPSLCPGAIHEVSAFLSFVVDLLVNANMSGMHNVSVKHSDLNQQGRHYANQDLNLNENSCTLNLPRGISIC